MTHPPPPAVARTDRGSRTLGIAVLAVAAWRVVAAVTMPPIDAAAPVDQLAASTILLVVVGVLYLVAGRLRASTGAPRYFMIQGTLTLGVGMFSQSLWLFAGLVAALAIQAAGVVRRRWRL